MPLYVCLCMCPCMVLSAEDLLLLHLLIICTHLEITVVPNET